MIPCSHPVLPCAEAKSWEARLLTDEAAEWSAMQRAGTGVAEAVAEDFKEIGGLPPAARVLILVGKGHNGGDALLAGQALLGQNPGATARVLLVFGERALRPLARRALDGLRQSAGGRVAVGGDGDLAALAQRWDLCLDGIFGFQFRAPLDPAAATLIEAVNGHRSIALRASIDLPSGVGETTAPVAFRADFTYATGIVKSPALLAANAAFVGRLRCVELGLVDDQSLSGAAERILTAGVLAPLGGLRPAQSDKRSYGHLLVVGGSLSYPGAVVLAVRAALRSGAGLVTAFVPENLVPEFAAHHPEAMWVGCPVDASGGLARATLELVRARLARASGLLIGPGLGADPATIALAGEIVGATSVTAVLDADALRPEVIARARPGSFIVTPHAGELQRIAGGRAAEVFCRETGAVLVQKGPMTRLLGRAGLPSGQDGPTYYSLFGGPVLARGGSGDVLAGLVGGLVAQRPAELLLAACRGAVWHGRAADLLARSHGQVAVETAQLLEQLGPALTTGPARSLDPSGMPAGGFARL